MIIRNKIIPFGNYIAINLFGIVFTKVELDEIDINHENIHSKQMLEVSIVSTFIILCLIGIFNISAWWLLLAIPSYYIVYCIEHLCIRLLHTKQSCAYHDISFEEEAHNNDSNLDYLKSRKYFSWVKYLKIKHYRRNCR